MRQLKAVLFGAIGTIAETSDLQRRAFNIAFLEAGLDWVWDPATYRELLRTNGGQARMRAYKDSVTGASISEASIVALHAAKTKAFVDLLAAARLRPRAGVRSLMDSCLEAGVRLAFCTSTDRANVDAIRAALGDGLNFEHFAPIVTIDKIARAKPAPDAYLYALAQLGLTANQVVAIEDSPVSIAAAKAAGIVTLATPGEMTADQDFSAADLDRKSVV